MKYAVIENGSVVGEIAHGRPYKNISFCKNSTEAEYKAAGLLPIQEIKVPVSNPLVDNLSFAYEVTTTKVIKRWVKTAKPQAEKDQNYAQAKKSKGRELAHKALVSILSQASPTFAQAISNINALPNDDNFESAAQQIVDNF